MSRRRRLMAVGFAAVAAAVGLATWRPWQKPPPVTIDSPGLDPQNAVTLQCVIAAGGPCTVIVTGRNGANLGRTTFHLPAGVSRSFLGRVQGPYVIDAVTVERDGKTHRQELNVTVPSGESRQITVKPDGAVEVGAISG